MIDATANILDFTLPFNPASVIILTMGKEALMIFLRGPVLLPFSDDLFSPESLKETEKENSMIFFLLY